MLTFTRRRVIVGTARRGGRWRCSTVRQDSREGGLAVDTHTIDEGREAPRLLGTIGREGNLETAQVGEGSSAGAAGALVGSGRGVASQAAAAAASSDRGGSLLSGSIASSSSPSEAPDDDHDHEKASCPSSFGIGIAATRGGIAVAAQRGGDTTTTSTFGGTTTTSSSAPDDLWLCCCCLPWPWPELKSRDTHAVRTNPRREDPPTPSLTDGTHREGFGADTFHLSLSHTGNNGNSDARRSYFKPRAFELYLHFHSGF